MSNKNVLGRVPKMNKGFTRFEMEPTKPYNMCEMMDHPYNVQNMLITNRDFPPCYFKKVKDGRTDYDSGDFVSSIYTDRIPDEQWKGAVKLVTQERNMDHWHGINKEELIAFASVFFAGSLKQMKLKITGVQITRWTNVSTGYPLWRIDVFGKSPKTPHIREYTSKRTVAYEGYGYYKEGIVIKFQGD